MSSGRLPTCDVCGVALDGVQHRRRTLLLIVDGAMVRGAELCSRHVDAELDAYQQARDTMHGVALARRGGEA